MKLETLLLWQDTVYRSAAENMALDHALFLGCQDSGVASLRFYTWDRVATTLGYFHQFEESTPAHAVRRFTGGGLVDHGEDVTFVLNFPSASGPADLSGPERYRWVHEALATALNRFGIPAALEETPAPSATGPCFENTVGWDIVDPTSGQKIGGGAQRRSRGAIIHQGSVRVPPHLRDANSDWTLHFASQLSGSVRDLSTPLQKEAIQAANSLETELYASRTWNSSKGS